MEFSNTRLLYHIINIYLNVIIKPDEVDYEDDNKFVDSMVNESSQTETEENLLGFSMTKLQECINKVRNINNFIFAVY